MQHQPSRERNAAVGSFLVSAISRLPQAEKYLTETTRFSLSGDMLTFHVAHWLSKEFQEKIVSGICEQSAEITQQFVTQASLYGIEIKRISLHWPLTGETIPLWRLEPAPLLSVAAERMLEESHLCFSEVTAIVLPPEAPTIQEHVDWVVEALGEAEALSIVLRQAILYTFGCTVEQIIIRDSYGYNHLLWREDRPAQA